MSGGYWNYSDSTLASEVFNYYLRFDNGLRGEKHDKELKSAIRINPLKDPEISGILFDIFCLLHSYDLAESGDASMDNYHKDVAAFKDRWLNKSRPEQIRETIDICMDNLKEDLYQAFLSHEQSGYC